MGRFFIAAIILLFSFDNYAQSGISDSTWLHIDTSIARKRNLADIDSLVRSLRQKAWAEHRYSDIARCYYNQIRIADQRTEDSFYFRNSAIIDSLLMTKNLHPELQLAMHVLKAKRLSVFTTMYKKFNEARYERKDIPFNYAAYSNHRLDSIAQHHFQLAKEMSISMPVKDSREFNWLSTDLLLFLFKPRLYDILAAEQISFYHSQLRGQNMTLIKKLPYYLSLSPDAFISSLDSIAQLPDEEFHSIKLYHEWLGYNSDNVAIKYFIESLARKSLTTYATPGGPNSPYEKYLRLISTSPHTIVRAYGVYQLCLLWNSWSKYYLPVSSYSRYQSWTKSPIDTAYCYYALKAQQLFDQNKAMLDSFSYLKNILLSMEQQIKATTIAVRLPRQHLPGESLLSEVYYKNVDTLYYRIIKMPAEVQLPSYEHGQALKAVLKMPTIKDTMLVTPPADDYNYHSFYLKFDPLPKGHYSILFSSRPVNDTNNAIENVRLTVTSVAVMTSHARVFVLDRKTGVPLSGAVVKGSYLKQNNKSPFSRRYIVNKQGYIDIEDKKIRNLDIYYGNDTSSSSIYISNEIEETPDDIYTKDEYDSLEEFYEDNAIAYVFTDRAIYRPGQTVHYKVIFLTLNSKTGQLIVMSEENIHKAYKRWLKDEEPVLEITDAFNNIADSIPVKLDEYGAMSGSFKIPKTAATGEWNIEPDYVEIADESGTFKVEEYKRPSYEISIETPKKELLPGDSFTVKAKVRSFAGAPLNNVSIRYTLESSVYLPVYDSISQQTYNQYISELLIDTIGFTNANGELIIPVDDSLFRRMIKEKNFTGGIDYRIEAEATDATGESYEEKARVNIPETPVSINLLLSRVYERSANNSIVITTRDKNAGIVFKKVDVKIYRLIKPKSYPEGELMPADFWLYPVKQLQEQFPNINITRTKDTAVRQLVLSKTIHTQNGRFVLDPAVLTAGEYEMEAVCEERGRITGKSKRSFDVFDEKENKSPAEGEEFYHFPYNSFSPGDTVKYYSGNPAASYNIYHVVYYAQQKKKLIRNVYEMRYDAGGINKWTWKIPADAIGTAQLTHIFILNNKVYKNDEQISIGISSEKPEIIIEQYRTKLTPGSKETFSVSVKTKNINTAAQLMTAMYDASLDKLADHKWEKPEPDEGLNQAEADWSAYINSVSHSDRLEAREFEALPDPAKDNNGLMWWLGKVGPGDRNYRRGEEKFIPGAMSLFGVKSRLNFSGSLSEDLDQANQINYYSGLANHRFSRMGYRTYNPNDEDVMGDWTNSRQMMAPMFRASGGGIEDTEGLGEVVVIGYGTRALQGRAAGVVITTSKSNLLSLLPYKQSYIILDGVPFEGDIALIDVATITEGITLKGADAVMLYGPKAANGVLVLSTKGPVILPEPAPLQPLPARKIFNETAFFFPAVHADKDGYFIFNFTMPESVTEWNWKLLAHTKDAKFAVTEKKLNTQLPLMIQPNMPRLLYQGDRIVLQSRITNLDTMNTNGNVFCRIEDVVTGEDITAKLVGVAQNNFRLASKASGATSFEIKVPEAQLNPLKIVISARTDNFVDGEEHIIPVLSPKIFVKQNLPFHFNKKDTVVQLPSLPAGAEITGIGLSIRPRPQAAIINALPYLAEFSFDCAEQITNKILARLLAIKIRQQDSTLNNSLSMVKKEMNNDTTAMPEELQQTAMPWVNLTKQTSLQRAALIRLFDKTDQQDAVSGLLQKLYKMQQADGGLSWFPEGSSNAYISHYVLASFGKIQKEQIFKTDLMQVSTHKNFIQKLVDFCDADFIKNAKGRDTLYYLYARSYWTGFDMPPAIHDSLNKIMQKVWKNENRYTLTRQALLINATVNHNVEKQYFDKAFMLLRSVHQLAIRDDINGTRWKDIADADDLTTSSEETIVMLAEAFARSTTYQEVIPGMIQWLLMNQQDHHWTTTKGTAAAVSMMYKSGKLLFDPPQSIAASAGNIQLSSTNDPFMGKIFSYTSTSTIPASVQLTGSGNDQNTGNLIVYYFSDKAVQPVSDITISKQLLRWNETTANWEPVDDKTLLKIADKVKVALTIQSSKALRHVYINDRRAAAFEPADNNSGYEYTKALSYYRSIRDDAMQFFADFIPSGRHVISYEVRVAQEGSFMNGPAVLECMYKPEVNAYSGSQKIIVGR